MDSVPGVSMRGKASTSWMPRAFMVRTAPRTSLRKISGRSESWNVSNVLSVYSLKHLPGPSRPALPVRCSADDLEMTLASRDSIPSRGRYFFTLALPQSTTYRTPGTVTDVSAIFVAKTIFRVKAVLTGRKASR
ncbi:hypothetical protein TCAP_02207 [Tolypocladium capitatum]|uniref:Uncharacterized protein n=1 Tax=Tolypocladium capitatum TaxID=45235 RepID=A0A2K3QK43_9HYPO|nr:hypothetical protein TCAP_02207 [Tolypocladium capitatum]